MDAPEIADRSSCSPRARAGGPDEAIQEPLFAMGRTFPACFLGARFTALNLPLFGQGQERSLAGKGRLPLAPKPLSGRAETKRRRKSGPETKERRALNHGAQVKRQQPCKAGPRCRRCPRGCRGSERPCSGARPLADSGSLPTRARAEGPRSEGAGTAGPGIPPDTLRCPLIVRAMRPSHLVFQACVALP